MTYRAQLAKKLDVRPLNVDEIKSVVGGIAGFDESKYERKKELDNNEYILPKLYKD